MKDHTRSALTFESLQRLIVESLRIGESLKSINFQLCRHLPKGMKRLFRNVEFQLLKNLILNGYLL